MGAYGIRCLIGIKSPSPCMTCLATREECGFPYLADVAMRTSTDLQGLIDKRPFAIYCRKLLRKRISPEEEKVLKDLKELGHMPIFSCLMQLQPAFEGHFVKDYTPIDALHVLLGGVLKDWVTIVVVILVFLKRKYPVRFGDCLTKLDEKLMNFQTNQSLPFRFRKFSEGKHQMTVF